MAAAFKQLAASPHWQRRPRDHIWGSTASTIDNVKLNGRLGRMTPLLRWVIVGRYKSFEGRTFDDGSNGGKCIIHMPFPAIASAAAAGAHAWQPRRTLLFFAGAVDGVCCVGARVRCAVAELWGSLGQDARAARIRGRRHPTFAVAVRRSRASTRHAAPI